MDIHLEKDVGGATFQAFGFTFVRIKNCKPTVDLGEAPMNSTLNCIGPSLKYEIARTNHPLWHRIIKILVRTNPFMQSGLSILS